MVIGLSYHTAPASVLERYWISEDRRPEVLIRLAEAEGVEEVVVLATRNRTEFWLWTNDPTLAENSVSRLLSAQYGLKLCEWEHFYRLLDEEALLHIFRVAAGLDSIAVDEPEITTELNRAWEQAKKAGSTGRFLDTVVQKALAVSERVRAETAIQDLKKHDREKVTRPNAGERSGAAEKVLAAEAHGFRSELLAEQVVPTAVGLRHRLDEFCRQELNSFREECGPFSKDQDEILLAVTSRLTQRIAGSLARELKEPPEKVERLFHPETPERALAGTKLREERRRSWPQPPQRSQIEDFVAHAEQHVKR
jgi:glutamyl-tRNA reductase